MSQDTFLLIGTLDSPTQGQVVNGLYGFNGWELHDPSFDIRFEFTLDDQPVEVKLDRTERPDVISAFPDKANPEVRAGFQAFFNTTKYNNGLHEFSTYLHSGAQTRLIARVMIEIANPPALACYRHAYLTSQTSQRARKFELLLPRLACPRCSAKVEPNTVNSLKCQNCNTNYAVSNGVPIMVAGEPEYPVEHSLLTSPPSNNPYPPDLLVALDQVLTAGGVALDLGSGKRGFGMERLIQLEISAYPFTDIVSQSELLPFQDASFDMVFSRAVTEHVKRPWVLAAEIQRILKKDGLVIVTSAFLQPLHGYPSHYYNMTHLALRDLFDQVEVTSLEVAPRQHPWFALSWILDHTLVDLPVEQRAWLENLSVQQFLIELQNYCSAQPNRLADLQLPSHRIEELAAGFTLKGRKL